MLPDGKRADAGRRRFIFWKSSSFLWSVQDITDELDKNGSFLTIWIDELSQSRSEYLRFLIESIASVEKLCVCSRKY